MGVDSSNLYEFLKKYQEDPKSRVFAPLAEAYRKAGMVDEAIDIAREGLRIHPHFIGGHVALARALFDKNCYLEVVNQLSAVIHDSPDNLLAQKLLGDSFLMLGKNQDALMCYKMILYYYPSDKEIAQLVQEIEAGGYHKGEWLLRSDSLLNSPVLSESSLDKEKGSQELAKKQWMRRIEILQNLLQKVERYRLRIAI